MKTGKKLLALLLAVVMTMSLLTVGAFAEETPSSETPLEQQDSGSGIPAAGTSRTIRQRDLRMT